MDKVRAKQIYNLSENTTGAANDECKFCFERGEEGFLFSFDVRDEDIISPYEHDNDNIYDGDAVEVFISPTGDRKHYYEIEVSPFGKRFWAKIVNSTGVELDLVDRVEPAYTAEVSRREGGYSVQIRLPYASLEGFDGEKYLINAYRLDKKKDGRQLLYALSPTFCPKFHRPKYFLSEEKGEN